MYIYIYIFIYMHMGIWQAEVIWPALRRSMYMCMFTCICAYLYMHVCIWQAEVIWSALRRGMSEDEIQVLEDSKKIIKAQPDKHYGGSSVWERMSGHDTDR